MNYSRDNTEIGLPEQHLLRVGHLFSAATRKLTKRLVNTPG
jgi:hypothetical protein